MASPVVKQFITASRKRKQVEQAADQRRQSMHVMATKAVVLLLLAASAVAFRRLRLGARLKGLACSVAGWVQRLWGEHLARSPAGEVGRRLLSRSHYVPHVHLAGQDSLIGYNSRIHDGESGLMRPISWFSSRTPRNDGETQQQLPQIPDLHPYIPGVSGLPLAGPALHLPAHTRHSAEHPSTAGATTSSRPKCSAHLPATACVVLDPCSVPRAGTRMSGAASYTRSAPVSPNRHSHDNLVELNQGSSSAFFLPQPSSNPMPMIPAPRAYLFCTPDVYFREWESSQIPERQVAEEGGTSVVSAPFQGVSFRTTVDDAAELCQGDPAPSSKHPQEHHQCLAVMEV